MLQSILGSESRAQVLTYLVDNHEGYATEISRTGGLDLYAVQQQLEKFESTGLVGSRIVGRMRVYAFNPEHPLLQELKRLIEKAHSYPSGLQTGGSSISLPQSLRRYFWDYSFKELSWEKDRELIIRRLLTDGSWDSIIWLRKQIGDGGLRKWLIAHQGRGLSPRQLRFWTLVLALPRRQVDAWARTARSAPWSTR
jgi:DNA-binding transcriptional ArsR family regulator